MKVQPSLNSFDSLQFDNRFVNDLPADAELKNFPRQVLGASYSKIPPTKVANPKTVAYSREVAELLDISEDVCQSDDFAQVFSGNRLLAGMEPYASNYGGHQFGVWAGQLGDGRAINLGDVINSKSERWALQLKGAGLTPYSRRADGLAVLRSSVREFLCSEAMYHLGVPTTRALSLVTTGEQVVRDMFYDGNPQSEPGAIVCRVAPSFLRFGHFQLYTARGEIGLLKKMLDYTINTHFTHLGPPSLEVYLSWFTEVCRSTARMVVEWQRVGFVHGVMNTDNMSILGLTIDYGPYGWLENYDSDWTPNTTDAEEKRYRFGNQPACAYWNLVQLANAIYPIILKEKRLQEALKTFVDVYEGERRVMFNRKLGLERCVAGADDSLHADLLALLQIAGADMTIFFRHLADINLEDVLAASVTYQDIINLFATSYFDFDRLDADFCDGLLSWLRRYQSRLEHEDLSAKLRRERMNRVNPKYVLRNYLAQLAIDKAEQGDNSKVIELLDILRNPYDEQPEFSEYAVKRPDWAKSRAGCSMLSCSS